MGIILAVVALCAICSTAESRAAGAIAAKPFARVAGIVAAVLWAAILLLPHGKG